jgi:archaellum component FlaC
MEDLQEQVDKLKEELEIAQDRITDLEGTLEDIAYQAKHAVK